MSKSIKSAMASVLYSTKEPIRILNGSAVTNRVGPAGVGFSSFRPSGVKTSVKLSNAALVLDWLLVDKAINVLETEDIGGEAAAYFEFQSPRGPFFNGFITDKLSVSYEGTEEPEGAERLVPVVVFALSCANHDKCADELRGCFDSIMHAYQENGVAEFKDVMQFCDAFYYGFAKNHEEFEAFLDDMSPQTIQQTYQSKYFEVADFMDDIEGKPDFRILKGIPLRPSKKSRGKSVAAVSNVFKDCMEGKRAIDFEWTEEQQLKIPELEYLQDFIPSQHFYSLLNKIEQRTSAVLERMQNGLDGIEAIKKDYINSFIIGKPGTGKTTMAYALGAALRMPVYTIAVTKNTEEDTFQGMTKVVDGGFKFVSTDFLEAYTHGGIIILEEVNLADPSVIMGCLGQAVEAPFILMQDGYKAVRRHPLCVVLGTMNIGTYGAKGVSQAFSSRFKQTYILDDPKKEDFISILVKQGHEQKKCVWVYDAYQKIINYLKSPDVSREEICLNVTLRGCLGALDNMMEGDTPEQAVFNTLVGKVAEVDLDLANDIGKNIIKSLPNLI